VEFGLWIEIAASQLVLEFGLRIENIEDQLFRWPVCF
jgi:hypothetical protein